MSATPSRDVAAVIVAAGRSTRFAPEGGEARKPLVRVEGRALLELACEAFARSARVAEIVVVAHAEDRERVAALLAGVERLRAVVPGGRERTDSVRAGVRATGERARLVAVHDAARPLVSTALVDAVCARAAEEGAALAALPLRDTVKESDDGLRAARTLERGRLWAAQTPQVFARERFLALLEQAEREGWQPTDDAALWERAVGPVALVPGEPANLKVTAPEDLELVRALCALRAAAAEGAR